MLTTETENTYKRQLCLDSTVEAIRGSMPQTTSLDDWEPRTWKDLTKGTLLDTEEGISKSLSAQIQCPLSTSSPSLKYSTLTLKDLENWRRSSRFYQKLKQITRPNKVLTPGLQGLPNGRCYRGALWGSALPYLLSCQILNNCSENLPICCQVKYSNEMFGLDLGVNFSLLICYCWSHPLLTCLSKCCWSGIIKVLPKTFHCR